MPNELTFYDNKGEQTSLYAITVSDCNSVETPADDLATLNKQKQQQQSQKPVQSKTKRVPWWKSFWRRAFGK
jgi:hypothetical protein